MKEPTICSIANKATLVFPAPVGAHTSIFSELSIAVLKTLL